MKRDDVKAAVLKDNFEEKDVKDQNAKLSPSLFLFAKVISEIAGYYKVKESYLICEAVETEGSGFSFNFGIRTDRIGEREFEIVHAGMQRLILDIALEDESGTLIVNAFDMTIEAPDKLSLLMAIKGLFENSDKNLSTIDQMQYTPNYDHEPVFSWISSRGMEMDEEDHLALRKQQTKEYIYIQGKKYREEYEQDQSNYELFLSLETIPYISREFVHAALYRANAANISVPFTHLYKTILQEERGEGIYDYRSHLDGGYN